MKRLQSEEASTAQLSAIIKRYKSEHKKLLAKIANPRWEIAHHYHMTCVTRDHQALVRGRGWTDIERISVGEEVWALVEKGSDRAQWSAVTATVKHPLRPDEELYEFRSDGLNLLTNKDHLHWVREGDDAAAKWVERSSGDDQWGQQEAHFPTAATHDGVYQWPLEPFLPADINTNEEVHARARRILATTISCVPQWRIFPALTDCAVLCVCARAYVATEKHGMVPIPRFLPRRGQSHPARGRCEPERLARPAAAFFGGRVWPGCNGGDGACFGRAGMDGRAFTFVLGLERTALVHPLLPALLVRPVRPAGGMPRAVRLPLTHGRIGPRFPFTSLPDPGRAFTPCARPASSRPRCRDSPRGRTVATRRLERCHACSGHIIGLVLRTFLPAPLPPPPVAVPPLHVPGARAHFRVAPRPGRPPCARD